MNIFSPPFPVNPRYFADREEVIASFRRALSRSVKSETPTPDNIAILGDWGMGKSSVLRKFEDIALNEFKDRRIFSAIIELIPSACNSFVSFTRKVMDDIEKNFNAHASILVRVRNEVKNWRISSIGTGVGLELERKIRERSPASVFEGALRDLWDVLETSGIDTILLMFDDLHYLAEGFPDGLYDLRGIFQGLPRHGCNFILCVSGERELFSRIRELAEPLARFFNIKHRLNSFDYDGTRSAITRPLRLTNSGLTLEEDVIQRIHAITNGHPYFVHFIMRELMSLRDSGRITLKFFENHYPSIRQIMEREKFEVDFSIASEKERQVLLEIARIKSERFSPSSVKIKNARIQIKSLVKKGLLIRHNRGEYSLYHPLFKEYLVDQCVTT